MPTIPRSVIERYSRQLNAICDANVDALADALTHIDWTADVATIREQLVAMMQTWCGVSSEQAATLAKVFYDGLRSDLFDVTDGFEADVVTSYEPEATEGAVRAFVQDLVDGKQPKSVIDKCLDRLDYESRKSANKCIERNVNRDPMKPKWARVPTGPETCEFCIMLASRGFVYGNEDLASHAHANCDCRVVPSWDKKKAAVEGYDPNVYYEMWLHQEEHGGKAQSDDGIDWPDHVKPITNNQFKELRELAEEAGIRLEGFRHAGIDPEAVKSYIESAARILNDFPEFRLIDGKLLTIRLSGLYSEDFAETGYKGDYSVVRVNAKSLISKDALEREYGRLADEGWFVRGTTSSSVIFHEFGHIYCYVHKVDTEAIVHSVIGLEGAEAISYLEANLSRYSARFMDLREAIPEAFSGYYGNSDNGVSKLIMEGVLNL